MAQKIRSYADLLQKIHDDLRLQHPEWIQPNGDCPTCDSYKARLKELLASPRGSSDVIALADRDGSRCQ